MTRACIGRPVPPDARPSGHPARGRFSPWQVSWLAGRRLHPSSRGAKGPSDIGGSRLAAYSCGGSAGLAALRATHRLPSSLRRAGMRAGDHDGRTLRAIGRLSISYKEMFMSLICVAGMVLLPVHASFPPASNAPLKRSGQCAVCLICNNLEFYMQLYKGSARSNETGRPVLRSLPCRQSFPRVFPKAFPKAFHRAAPS